MVTIEFDVSESHAARLDELRQTLDVDVDAELANLVMRSIDQTYMDNLEELDQ